MLSMLTLAGAAAGSFFGASGAGAGVIPGAAGAQPSGLLMPPMTAPPVLPHPGLAQPALAHPGLAQPVEQPLSQPQELRLNIPLILSRKRWLPQAQGSQAGAAHFGAAHFGAHGAGAAQVLHDPRLNNPRSREPNAGAHESHEETCDEQDGVLQGAAAGWFPVNRAEVMSTNAAFTGHPP